MPALPGPGGLWIEASDYLARLFAGGRWPWTDPTASLALQRKGQGLLRSAVLGLPLGALVPAWLASQPALGQAMAEKTRLIHPLRTLLADEALRRLVSEHLQGLRASFPQTCLALCLPAPGAALVRAWRAVHAGEPTAISEDDIDAAAVRQADFLRGFGDSGVDLLVLEEPPGTPLNLAAVRELYAPLFNLAAHYRWTLALLVDQAPAPVPDLRLIGRDGSGDSVHYLPIDAQAQPEAVLDQLAVLRQRLGEPA